jgi:hypothetical protein
LAKENDSIALHEAARNLNTAFNNCFDKKHPGGFFDTDPVKGGKDGAKARIDVL